MIPKIWMINMVLALAAAFIGLQAYQSISAITPEDNFKRPTPQNGPKTSVPSVQWKTSPESAYAVIVNRNLFSEERQPPTRSEQVLPETEVKVVNISGQQITLYGVILTDDYRIALISNPTRKNGQKSTRWIRPGDRIESLEVESIQKDSITFREGEKRTRIVLYDDDKVINRESITTDAQPNVVTTEPKKEPEKPKVAPMVEPTPEQPKVRLNPFTGKPMNQ